MLKALISIPYSNVIHLFAHYNNYIICNTEESFMKEDQVGTDLLRTVAPPLFQHWVP